MRKLKLEELNRLNLDAFKKSPKIPITVVLDNIRSAHNVGSIFRTCDALGLHEIILTGITAKPPHKEINKAAIGATKSVDWSYHSDVADYIKSVQSPSSIILGIEQTSDSQSLVDFKLDRKSFEHFYVVMGNEVDGISDSILSDLDKAIEIPQYGTKHSFNVSVCAGIVLWEFSEQLRHHVK